MRLSRLLTATALVFFSSLGFASAQDNAASPEMIMEGMGYGSNEAEATMAAKRDAVEKGIGTTLISQTEIQNFMVKKDLVISKTVGSVSRFDIISKNQASDGSWEVKIKAVISKSMMRDDLASFQILLESMDKPKVMVLIKENNVGNDEPTNAAAEGAVIKFLKSPYDFEIVDPDMISQVRADAGKMNALSDNAAEAAALGRSYGAEVLISGSAVAREAEAMAASLGGMKSVQADVTLKAISCATGRVIATGTGHSAKVHISPNTAGTMALAAAAEKASGDLLKTIIEDWNKQLNNGMQLTLTIKGASSFKVKGAILNSLKTMSGVVSINERGWDGASGILTANVSYKGNVQGFCERADGFKLSPDAGVLAVTGQTASNINLSVQAK